MSFHLFGCSFRSQFQTEHFVIIKLFHYLFYLISGGYCLPLWMKSYRTILKEGPGQIFFIHFTVSNINTLICICDQHQCKGLWTTFLSSEKSPCWFSPWMSLDCQQLCLQLGFLWCGPLLAVSWRPPTHLYKPGNNNQMRMTSGHYQVWASGFNSSVSIPWARHPHWLLWL